MLLCDRESHGTQSIVLWYIFISQCPDTRTGGEESECWGMLYQDSQWIMLCSCVMCYWIYFQQLCNNQEWGGDTETTQHHTNNIKQTMTREVVWNRHEWKLSIQEGSPFYGYIFSYKPLSLTVQLHFNYSGGGFSIISGLVCTQGDSFQIMSLLYLSLAKHQVLCSLSFKEK